MKKFLFGAAALISLVPFNVSADAADVTTVATAYDWSGFYVGVNAGVAWNNSDISNDVVTNDGSPVWDFVDEWDLGLDGNETSFTGGALIGYNWQYDSLVLGLEADINYLGFSEDRENTFEIIEKTAVDGSYEAKSSLSFEADWFGTLRGRLGFAADNFLFYGTGGLAYGHMQADGDIHATDDGYEIARWKGSVDDLNWGWTIGAGMQYGIDRWSLCVEYPFVDLGDADWDSDFDGNDKNFDGFSTEGAVDYQFSVVRATAKMQF